MKKFIWNNLLFIVCLTAILFAIKTNLPYYWGNKFIGQKIEYIQKNEFSFDTYFIGSSKTYRHIDPLLFDSITQANSFNLGCVAMFPLETSYILDKFIQESSLESKTTFFLQSVDPIDISVKNFHSIRSKYFMDYKRWKMSMKYYVPKSDYRQVYRHTISFIENKLCIGEIFEIFKYHLHPILHLDESIASGKGFYSLDKELNEHQSKKLINRKKNYKRKNKSKPSYSRKSILSFCSDSDYIFDNDMIRVVKIDPIRIAQKHNFDRGHYNEDGARIYTTKLGKVYKLPRFK